MMVKEHPFLIAASGVPGEHGMRSATSLPIMEMNQTLETIPRRIYTKNRNKLILQRKPRGRFETTEKVLNLIKKHYIYIEYNKAPLDTVVLPCYF